MAKIDNIQALGETLGASTIHITPKRCTYIRNRNSSCEHCLTACSSNAIERQVGRLHIDAEACTDCGACASACPTNTFITTAPDPEELVRQARLSADVNGGTACFTCDRNAQEHDIDRSRVVVLPCLDYLDEYLILGLFASGTKRIAIMRRDCKGCPIDHEGPYIDKTIATLEQLQEEWKFRIDMLVTDRIPEDLIGTDRDSQVIGTGRREAFRQAGGSALDFVARTVNDMITGAKPEDEEKRQILVRPDERFAPNTYRSIRILNALRHLASPDPEAFTRARFWTQPILDAARCLHCGSCAMFCPTQALSYLTDAEEGQMEENRAFGSRQDSGAGSLHFRPALCVHCDMCRDTCLTHSLSLANRVRISDLIDDVTITLFEHEKPSFN